MKADASLRRYLNDIRKSRVLSREEERDLFLAHKAGDPKAQEKLAKANLRFVLDVALKFRHSSIPLPDLINEGAIGLLHAITVYDPSRGLKFITFAVWWIRAYMTRALHEKSSLIRIPSNKMREITRGKKMGFPEDHMDCRLLEILRLRNGISSLDSPVTKGSDTLWLDVLTDPDPVSPLEGLIQSESSRLFEALFSQMESDEAELLRLLYGFDGGEPFSLKEASVRLGVSLDSAKRMHLFALKSLRSRRKSFSDSHLAGGFIHQPARSQD
ncbi:MAG TPA: sigma-70 family RNA polymerase sigma factor [Fibrobacteria bacterium]|nr:sigma-70 family RNA polymerase sigma factor [Fibrobacteria bacterium]